MYLRDCQCGQGKATRGFRRGNRRYFESLESRNLLSDVNPFAGTQESILIPLTNNQDFIYDDLRDRLYITDGTDLVRRFDFHSRDFLAPWTIGTSVILGDITVNGDTLYLS